MAYTLAVALMFLASGATAAPDATLTSILGIEIGTASAQVHRLLAPLGVRDAREDEGSTKEVWRLTETGFAWIALKMDADGRVVWITGHRRKGQEIPFDTFVKKPDVDAGTIAIWHVNGTHSAQRMTLRGAGRRAQVITLVDVPRH